MFENKLRSLPLKDITIRDSFWSRYIDLVQDVIIGYQWNILNDQIDGAEKSHCIDNFKIAAGLKKGKFKGQVFQDTDVAKWIEASSYSLEYKRNKKIEDTIDEVVELIEKAQCSDGYINTYFTIAEPGGRWSNLMEGHELYTAGHFIEAAVAYYEATGKTKFLNIMRKFADYICTVFGNGEGKINGYPGHPEVELALVKLYRVTKDKKYLDIASYFINERGKKPFYFDKEREKLGYKYIFPDFEKFGKKYNQTWLPVRKQETAEGHAVRAVYLYTAMADVSYENKDKELFEACEKLYNNIVKRRIYITGSIGSASYGERFTCDYDLPNDTNYSESCASIGLAMFAKRMLEITQDGKYADTIENALYNTMLAGISLDGRKFFYVNPLEVWPESCENNPAKSHVADERQKWFGCACCPTNITRTLASLGQYAYSIMDDKVFINLYIAGKVNFKIADKCEGLNVITKYPFEDMVKIEVENSENMNFTIAARIPGWCRNAKIKINNKEYDAKENIINGYAYMTRTWASGDSIEIKFDMKPRLVFANPKVRADEGKAAIMNGPLIYCLEECDNCSNLSSIEISPDVKLKSYFDADILGGTEIITADAEKLTSNDWGDELYRYDAVKKENIKIKAVPYCLWNNRGKGEMLVWIRLS